MLVSTYENAYAMTCLSFLTYVTRIGSTGRVFFLIDFFSRFQLAGTVHSQLAHDVMNESVYKLPDFQTSITSGKLRKCRNCLTQRKSREPLKHNMST